MSDAEAQQLLADLRPTADLKVMDLVQEAGVDVSPWLVKEDGGPVKNPKANPNYCYEWAFGVGSEPIVLCVWHEQLTPHDGSVAFVGNLKARAAALEEIVLDRREPSSTRSRAKKQAKRCDSFDFRVQRAFRQSVPVRVILLVGERADKLGHDASKVSLRRLDSEVWQVDAYEPSGRFALVRGVPGGSLESKADPVQQTGADQDRFVDQFSAAEPPDRKERKVDVFVRSAEVRRQVLIQAGGICERCGKEGFLTAGGQTYLETHHVTALGEGGLDAVSNVVALCPEDHRRAHHAADREQIRDELMAYLASRQNNWAV